MQNSFAFSALNTLMQIDVGRHLEETTLEQYSMGSLAEDAATEVEQHLLICGDCCTKVTEADAYIRAMKGAVQELPAAPERSRWNLRFLVPTFAVCTLLIVAAIVKFPASVERSPVTIALFTMRGTDTEAHGSARRPFALQPDLHGLPDSPSYRLDLVAFSGSPVWKGVLYVQPQPPTAIVPAQSRGVYFVRVSLPSGELLREYALELSGRD
jgi:hypothetical protein